MAEDEEKFYRVTQEGAEVGVYQGPGETASVVEGYVGKTRGKDNIVPKLAKLKMGDSLDAGGGIEVERVEAPVPEQPEEPVEPEPPTEPPAI